MKVKNYIQYRMDLEYNNKNVKEIEMVLFDIAYDFRSQYGFKDMNDMEEWEIFVDRLEKDIGIYRKYVSNFYAGGNQEVQKVIEKKYICDLEGTHQLVDNCLEKKKEFNILEQLYGKWFKIKN